jgi:hypothetical protein
MNIYSNAPNVIVPHKPSTVYVGCCSNFALSLILRSLSSFLRAIISGRSDSLGRASIVLSQYGPARAQK